MAQLSLLVLLVLCGTVNAARKIVDLTHELKVDSVAFPIFPPMKIENTITYPIEYDGRNVTMFANLLTLIEHYGTHLDAPSHITDPNAPEPQWTLTEVPEDRLFMVPTRILNLREKAASNRDYIVTPEDITAHEQLHGQIPAGSWVLFDFGWGNKFSNPTTYLDTEKTGDNIGMMHFPGLGEAAVDLLIERDVAGVGSDCISPDVGRNHMDFSTLPAHLKLLPHNIMILENIAGMSGLPATGVELNVGVMKVHDGTGGPARLTAIYDDEAGVSTGFSLNFFVNTLVLVVICIIKFF